MRIPIKNKIIAGFAASVLALLCIGWLSYCTTTTMIATTESVARTHEVIAALADGLSMLTQAETAQRAYLLTGDEQFLNDCRAEQERVKAWVDKLRKLIVDSPEQQRHVNTLESLITKRLAILNNRITVRQQQGLEAAAAAVAQREGKEAMDQVQKVIAEMDAEESRLLEQRQQASRDSTRQSLAIILVGSAATCLFGLVAVLVVHRDLRKREQAEKELGENRALLQSILDNTPAVVFLKDPAGRYLFVNRRFEQLAGIPRDKIVDKTGFELFKKELAQTARDHDQRILEEGKPLEFEETVMYPDGPHTHLAIKFPLRDATGRIYATGGVSTDVTERKRAEDERDRFFNLSRDLMCIAGFDGFFKTINPAWQETLGFSKEELLASPFIEFVHPNDREATVAEAGKLAEGGETVQFENRYRCKDGSYRWLAWAARSHVSRQLIYATGRDVTEQKRTEEQIVQLNTDLERRAVQLETANKELEAFSYSVSHDLRAPLRHIDGFVDMLTKQSGDKLDERSRRYLSIISDSARQMGALIDDLLVFSRMGRVELRQADVNLNSLVREAVEGLQHDMAGRNINWKIAQLPNIQGDPAMLRQVLVNLIGNAVKYTRPRNPAEIEIGCDGIKPDEFVFFVRDNGVGFDMQYEHKLFGVFQRLHRSDEFEGTGIGLANVRRIIHRHGGRTWAEGKVDSGATFYCALPKQNRG